MTTQTGIDFKFKLFDEGVVKGLQKISSQMQKMRDATVGIGDRFGKVKTAMGGVADGFKTLSVAGAAVSGVGVGLVGWAKSATDAADDIGDMATRYGVASEAIQVYGDLVKDAGGSTEDAAGAFRFLNKSMSGALAGNKKMQEAFAGVGISVSELQSLKPEQVMMRVADAFKGSNNDLAKSAVLTQLMGKNGTIMMGVMNEGAAAIGKHYDEMGADGRLFTQEQLKSADALAKNWQRATGVFEGLKNTLGLELMQTLSPLIEQFRSWAVANKEVIASKFKEFLLHLPSLFESVVKVAEVLGGVFGALIAPLKWIGHNFGMTTAVVTALLVVCAPLILSVGSLAVAVWGLLAPFGLVAVLIGLVIAAGLMWYTRWDDICGGFTLLMSDLGDLFSRVGESIKGAWGGMIDWVSQKIEWIIGKFAALKEAASSAMPFLTKAAAFTPMGAAFNLGKAAYNAFTGSGSDGEASSGKGAGMLLAQKQQIGGRLDIKIDSEGRPRVTNMQATGGIDLFANTGVMGMAM